MAEGSRLTGYFDFDIFLAAKLLSGRRLGNCLAADGFVNVGFVCMLDLWNFAYKSCIDMVGRAVGRIGRADWTDFSGAYLMNKSSTVM